jgi:hypothetical protein
MLVRIVLSGHSMSVKARCGAALCFALAALLAAPAAFADQPPADTLEQPYGPDAKPPPPASAAASQPANPANVPPAGSVPPEQGSVVVDEPPAPDKRPRGPIRGSRRLALGFELGWNGLAGFGLVFSYHLTPNFTLDLGTGLSLTGFKGGFRGRYNFLTGQVTPFVGAGVLGSTGLGVVSGDFHGNGSNNPKDQVTIRVRPTVAVQTVAGIDWTNLSGFTLLSTLGYCFVLNDNVDVIAGTPTHEDQRAFDILFGSGVVVAMSAGYTFR